MLAADILVLLQRGRVKAIEMHLDDVLDWQQKLEPHAMYREPPYALSPLMPPGAAMLV
jgi:hypothetical protein